MTQDQTRQLGIEFERRVQIMYPNSLFVDKLDSDTIYAMLNEYQLEYVKQVYLLDDQTQSGTRAATKIAETVKALIKRAQIRPQNNISGVAYKDTVEGINEVIKAIKNATLPTNIEREFLALQEDKLASLGTNITTGDNWSNIFSLPEDYFLYVRSNSIIDKTYKSEGEQLSHEFVPNQMIKESDVAKVVGTHYNQKGIIRNPLVILESTDAGSPYIEVIHDSYTSIDAIDLVYYRRPYSFNVLDFNDEDMSEGAVHSYCELPYSCFEELVQGAVQMYMQRYKLALAQNNNKKKDEEGQQ